MNNKQVNEKLRKRAIDLGLCNQWQRSWKKDWSEDKMIAKYIEGIDFCLANDYPSNGFIKQNFSIEALRKGGVFVDDTHSILNYAHAVVKGNSHVNARYNDECIAEIYAADNAVVYVSAKGNSHVIVHVLGNATVTAEHTGNAEILVIRHSNESTIITKGKVRTDTELDWLK